MQIIKTEIYRFSIPMEPFAIATGIMDYAQNTLIKIYTDSGLIGIGECSAFPMIVGETQETCLVLARDFAKIWKGKNPLALEERLAELDGYIARNTTIKSAFDMALYDIAAKHANQPLYRFLGGTPKPIESDITVGIGTPEGMATKASSFKQNGASVIKVKLGKKPEEDVDRIAAIRNAIGMDIALRIDANQGWSYADAIIALRGLEKYEIQFCEQPMRTYNDYLLPRLLEETSIPIMADESCYDHHDAERLIANESCDSINIKLAKSGGLREALRIHEVASAHKIPCMIGGMLESRVALTAKVHFAYACPGVIYYDMDTCLIGHLQDPVIGGVQFKGYHVSIPEDAIGIGVDVEGNFLSACERWEI
ncbi:mandelate racemase/muconate lactonizing enzyme family protein [Olivibacter sitiensis]|uniref:mandelate racemase/muconate lactonizing enzyme family protein n=1 Tax=Olivibacter sitiensis TaxID=376470 RepID=UPI000418FDD2|nr:dipeptide epimerase [Olivibacter sitiensis]